MMSETKSGPKVKAKAAEPKEKPAPAPAETKVDAKPDAAKSQAPKSEAPKSEAAMPDAAKSEAPKSYHRGEGQKPVTQAYKDNWNAIFGKKEKKKR
jgi:hypothetical protein